MRELTNTEVKQVVGGVASDDKNTDPKEPPFKNRGGNRPPGQTPNPNPGK